MKETKRKFYKKICKWKKQILCVGAGIFLGIAAWLAQGMDPVIEAGNVIQRPDIDDGQVDQELYVKGLVDQEKEVVLKLPVSARQYTKEEAYQAYEEILKQLPEWIKGDNLSLEEVRQDLELPAGREQECILAGSHRIRNWWKVMEPCIPGSLKQGMRLSISGRSS